MSPSPLRIALLASLSFTGVAHAEDESPPLSIYGWARLDILANDSRMSAVEEPEYVLVEPETGLFDGELTMTPRLSRVGLSIDQWEIDDDEKMTGEGKLEIDFAGGSGTNAIRLRHAYATLTAFEHAELLVGQTADLLSPLFPSTQNDTQLRFAGNTGDRRPQLRLSAYGNHIHVGVAAAASGLLDESDMDMDGQNDGMASGRPMLQWLVEARARGPKDAVMRLGLWGHVARQELDDGTRHAAKSVGMHFYAPYSDDLIVMGEGYVGDNLSDLGGGIGQGVNATTGKPIRSMGGWVEAAFLPTKKHMWSVGTSIDTARSEDLEVGDRRRNRTIYSVLRYKPRPALQLGLEYLNWRTHYKGMSDGIANRYDVHFTVFF